MGLVMYVDAIREGEGGPGGGVALAFQPRLARIESHLCVFVEVGVGSVYGAEKEGLWWLIRL